MTAPLGTTTVAAAIAPGAGKLHLLPNGKQFADPDGQVHQLDRAPDPTLSAIDRRVHKWVLHAAVKKLLPNSRTAHCCSAVLPVERRGVTGVEVWKSTKHQTAHYGNLMVCGSPWSCSICAPKIASKRAAEVEQAISAHQAAGGRVLFLTLTVPHYAGEELAGLVDGYGEALRSFWSRRGTKDALKSVGYLGSVRALEVTHGVNGWHPHTHYLLFVAADAEPWQIRAALHDQWAKTVDKRLDRQINGHGLTLQLVGSGSAAGGTDEDARQLAKYVVKGLEDSIWGAGLEMTLGHIKKARRGGRTPFALLHDYAVNADLQAGALFAEFVSAFHRRKQLVWSPGLRKRLLDLDVEATDQELAELADQEATLLGTLTLDQWWRVLAAPRKDTRGLLLEVAASGGWDSVLTFLDSLPERKRNVTG